MPMLPWPPRALLPALLPLLAEAPAQEPRTPLRLDDPGLAVDPAAREIAQAGEGPLRLAAWLDDRDQAFAEDLYVAVSLDYGLHWLPEQRLTSGSAFLIDVDRPQVAVAGGVLHVLWDDSSRSGGDTLFYARSGDQGTTWTVQQIAWPVADHEFAADGQDVVVVWSGGSFPNAAWSVWSRDGGLSFDPPRAVDPANLAFSDVDDFVVRLQDGTAHLLLEDDRAGNDDLWYHQASDGAAWSAGLRLDQDSSGTGLIVSNRSLRLVVDGSRLHAVWLEDRRTASLTDELYYRRSLDGGLTWEPEQQPGDWQPAVDEVSNPALAARGDTVLLAWSDDRDAPDFPPRVVASADGGATWGTPVVFPGAGVADQEVRGLALRLDASSAILGWFDSSSTPSLASVRPRFAFTTDGGFSWSETYDLSTFSSNQSVDGEEASWCFEGGSFTAVVVDGGGPAASPQVLAGGMRLPWIGATLSLTNLFMTMDGIDPAYEGQTARWAGSTNLDGFPHPDNPELSLDLGPSSSLDYTLQHINLLSTVIQGGAAVSDILPIPPLVSGRTYFAQGWIVDNGLGLLPTDVITITFP